MRKRIILSLSFLFALFTIGAGFSMYYISTTSRQLNQLVTLHQVEIMRQDLIISLQTVQSDLYTINTVFGEDLDRIVEHVIRLDHAVNRCQTCHHRPDIQRRIDSLQPLVGEYKFLLSRVITTSANRDRILVQMSTASDIGHQVLNIIQEMTFVAQKKLQDRTIEALREINNSRNILVVTLIGAFFIALGIAVSLTSEITRPVLQLLEGARSIASGRFDQPLTYSSKNEFGELAAAFNHMRLSLEDSQRRIMTYVRQLSGLHGTTISIHAVGEKDSDVHAIYDSLSREVGLILNVERCSLFLMDETSGRFTIPFTPVGSTDPPGLSLEKAQRLFDQSEDGICFSNAPASDSRLVENWPFPLEERNMLLAWIHRKGRILGVIRAANKIGDPFRDEDAQILSILANHIAVAIENKRLYDNLKKQMLELKQAQEQLIQSTKLAAIGELASNVAHEINNPLTSILGYTELLKEEEDLGTIRNDLAIIEQESLRARMIVRQLLEFSRRRPLDIQKADVCQVLGSVLPLVGSKARSSRVEIVQNLCNLPPIFIDTNQIQQVFINIINNAIFAMDGGGQLTISTTEEDNQVSISFRDTGPGIPDEIRNRIFEPFFSTKKDKGTGLGLSISYSIIQKHGGDIRLETGAGMGTTFIISLPKTMPAVVEVLAS